jgi:hypothetical protein
MATGTLSTATGFNAKAGGGASTATGQSAQATGDESTATGADARATGIRSTAIGAGTRAAFANSAAFGANVESTRANQMAFGRETNTYTMAGIASAASRAAQQGPLEVVTTDAQGNLASDGGALQRQIDNLGRRDGELADGIAIALALQQPIFHSGQKFAGRLGYGNFDGSNALGLSLAGVIDRGSFGSNSSITLDGGVGVGTSTGTVAAKAGVTFGW